MANLTLSDYRELFKRYLQEDPDDASNQFYPDAQIDAFLNSAQLEILTELSSTLNFYRKTATVDATSGDIELPEDFFSGLNVKFTNDPSLVMNWNLQIVDADRMDQMYPWWRSEQITSPYPTTAVFSWKPTGKFITLYPLLTSTVTDGLFYNYVPRPPDMTDDEDEDESEIMNFFPELQRTLLPFGALRYATGFEAGEADDQMQKYDALWQAGLRQARLIINSQAQRFWQYGSGF